MSWKLFLLLGSFSIASGFVIVALYRRIPNLKSSWSLKKWISAAVVVPAVMHFSMKAYSKGSLVEAYRNGLPPWYLTEQYYEYANEQERLAAYFKDLNNIPPSTIKNQGALKKKHILIFGESATRLRMGIYGYFRNNTPNFSAVRDELLIFENAWATSPPMTYWNLKKINTFIDRNSPPSLEPKYSLVQMMKAAGFSTAWLSNQVATGTHNNYTTAMALSADHHVVVNTTEAQSFDEKLLKPLEEYLLEKTESAFIILHLMGSHIIYSDRYPERFKKFVDSTDIPFRPYHNDFKRGRYNDYDNSILYTDHVLNQMLLLAKKYQVDSFIYVSDHGEETFIHGDYSGHPTDPSNPNLLAIPLIMYLNPNVYSEEISILKTKTKMVVSSDDLIHTLMDIYQIDMPEYKKDKSLLQKEYIQSNSPF